MRVCGSSVWHNSGVGNERGSGVRGSHQSVGVGVHRRQEQMLLHLPTCSVVGHVAHTCAWEKEGNNGVGRTNKKGKAPHTTGKMVNGKRQCTPVQWGKAGGGRSGSVQACKELNNG